MMIFYIIVFLLSFLVTWLSVPGILAISLKRKLVDIPCERSIHSCHAIRLAGIAFLPSIVIAIMIITFLMYEIYQQPEFDFRFFLFCSVPCLLMYLLGIVDDIKGVRYRTKFFYQFLAAGMIVYSGCWLDSLYGCMGVYTLSNWQSLLFSFFVIILIINSINLIDGIDGLAAGIGFIATFVYGICFCLRQEIAPAILSFATSGTLFSFLRYNLLGYSSIKIKVFMGDTGALLLGTILSILSLQLCLRTTGGKYADDFFFLIAYSALIIPCFDVIRVFVYRIKIGKSPFMPDTNHIHHKLMKLFKFQRISLWLIITLDLLLLIFNFLLYKVLSAGNILLVDIVLWIVLHLLIEYKIKNKQIK